MANSADSDQKPTDLDLHCLQRQGISRFSRTRVIAINILCCFQMFVAFLLAKIWSLHKCVTNFGTDFISS